MEPFLPLKFVQPEVDVEELWDDMQKTLNFLGSPPFAFSQPKEIELPAANPSPLHPLVKKLNYQLSVDPPRRLSGEDFLRFTIRRAFSQEILNALPSLLDDIIPLMAACKKRALPFPLLTHLMLKVGQLVEGSLKLHFLYHPIESGTSPSIHAAFDEVEGRPRRYVHHLTDIWQAEVSEKHQALLEKWAHFATWTRYPHKLPPFLQKAALLYNDLHTQEEYKEMERLEIAGKERAHLLELQKKELLPEVRELIALSERLLRQKGETYDHH